MTEWGYEDYEGKDYDVTLVPMRTVDASFDERLLDFALDIYSDQAEQGRVDKFWTNLYYFSCLKEARLVLNAGSAELEGIQILPVSFDETKGSIDVLLAATWYVDEVRDEFYGDSPYVTLYDNGTFMKEGDTRVYTYSSRMQLHIESLLAHTLLHFEPLDTCSPLLYTSGDERRDIDRPESQ